MSNIIIAVRPLDYYGGPKVLDGNTYRLDFYWNNYTSTWYMNIKGVSNSVEINGIALLPGKDLLAPHGYSELGELWMIDNQSANANPNFDDMGSRFSLEYVPLNA